MPDIFCAFMLGEYGSFTACEKNDYQRTISNKSEENQRTKFPGNCLFIIQKQKGRVMDYWRDEGTSLTTPWERNGSEGHVYANSDDKYFHSGQETKDINYWIHVNIKLFPSSIILSYKSVQSRNSGHIYGIAQLKVCVFLW
jgi:hypothetical protein